MSCDGRRDSEFVQLPRERGGLGDARGNEFGFAWFQLVVDVWQDDPPFE